MMKNHIKDFAKSLNNESLLILGGTGLFGKTLLPALVKEIEENNINTKITIVTRNKSNALANIPVLKNKYLHPPAHRKSLFFEIIHPPKIRSHFTKTHWLCNHKK